MHWHCCLSVQTGEDLHSLLVLLKLVANPHAKTCSWQPIKAITISTQLNNICLSSYSCLAGKHAMVVSAVCMCRHRLQSLHGGRRPAWSPPSGGRHRHQSTAHHCGALWSRPGSARCALLADASAVT